MYIKLLRAKKIMFCNRKFADFTLKKISYFNSHIWCIFNFTLQLVCVRTTRFYYRHNVNICISPEIQFYVNNALGTPDPPPV